MFKKNNMDLIPILRGSVNLKVNDVNSAVGYATIGGIIYTTHQISEKSPAKIAAGWVLSGIIQKMKIERIPRQNMSMKKDLQ